MHCLFLTNNPHKAREYRRILEPYGMHVHTPNLNIDDLDMLLAWIHCPELMSVDRITKWIPSDIPTNNLWVMREQSHLEFSGHTSPNTPCIAHHVSKLSAIHIPSQRQWRDEHTPRVAGIFTPTPTTNATDGFGWDGQFTMLSTGMTLSEAASMGIKCSARDIALDAFATEHLRFAEYGDLQHAPQSPQRVVDFAITPENILEHTPIKYAITHPILGPMLQTIIAQGIFFRSAQSRRDRNYWFPGLNGGIPLTPKSDDIHESTFMFHDMMHHLSPDLIVDGPIEPAQRRVYIVHRMIGEAISLVLADYLFVDHLRRSGIDYNYAKRRIHPIYTSMDPDGQAHHDPEALIKLLWASTQHALLGIDTAITPHVDTQHYRSKYDNFFIKDYAWTRNNLEDMNRIEQQRMDFTQWSQYTPTTQLHLSTVRGFIHAHNLADNTQWNTPTLVKRIFDAIIQDSIRPALHAPISPTPPADHIRSSGFLRYMYGQLMLLWTYDHVGGITAIRYTIYKALQAYHDQAHISLQDIEQIRQIYRHGVHLIAHAHACTPGDAHMFNDVAPLFSPNYQFYESRYSPINTIPEAAEHALNE